MRHPILRIIVRLSLAIGCFGYSFWAATTGYATMNLTRMVLSLPLFVIGVIAIWEPLFSLLTRPLIALVDDLFFPGGKLEKPVLNLKLPAYLINEGRFEEALEEYRRILKNYPNEVEAYEKAIWLYQEVFHEPAKARRLMDRARRRNLTLDERFYRLLQARDSHD